MSVIESILLEQAEKLLDQFLEWAGKDKKRLIEIGEWWRINHIARFYYDDIELTEEELTTIREGEKLYAQRKPNLPKKKIKQIENALAATQYERDLGLGLNCCIRITRHRCTDEESVILFRMASERYAFAIVSSENRDEIAKAERISFATRGSHAQHSKPDGAWKKADRIRNIWASGKYTSRDICAEQEFAALGWNYSSARKALRNTPEPTHTTPKALSD
jgi:hypothetical protein